MKLGSDMSPKQIQRMAMSPDLIQGLGILAMPQQELEQLMERAVEENLFLELAIDGEEDGGRHDPLEDEEGAEERADFGPAQTELARLAEYLDNPDAGAAGASPWESGDEQGERASPWEPRLPEPGGALSLRDHLLFQLNVSRVPAELKPAMQAIIENIDPDGYLRVELEEIVQIAGIEPQAAARALVLVQKFDPPGVGARNLSECLELQLRARGIEDRGPIELVRRHLPLLAIDGVGKLARVLGRPPEEVQKWADLIRTLDPRPGRNFGPYRIEFPRPDIVVERFGESLVVLVDQSGSPRLVINETYRKLLDDPQGLSPETCRYLNDKLRSALCLLKNIEQRRQTLLRVSETIVRHQEDFLKGRGPLVPLTLLDVAEKIGIHESTVSRAVCGKWIQTPRGMYELKYFFSQSVGRVHGKTPVSAQCVKQMIKTILESEDPEKPLSDAQIRSRLLERGIDISRRTVAKYRTELSVPAAQLRRRYC